MLDVEQRLAQIMRDYRQVMQDAMRQSDKGGNIYNSMSDSGQTNQGGDVQSEQRRQL